MSSEMQLALQIIELILLPVTAYTFHFIIRVERKLAKIETKLGIED